MEGEHIAGEENINSESKHILIGHFTKEIEIVSNNIMAFRMKSSFTVWIAPYLLLGSVIIAAKGTFSLEVTGDVKSALVLAAIAYFILGLIAGFVERGAWRRCNELRKGLVKLAPGYREVGAILPDQQIVKYVLPAYILVFTIIGASFAAISYVAIDIKFPVDSVSQAVPHNAVPNKANPADRKARE